jgi:two-component system, OmpR family, sensor kinase
VNRLPIRLRLTLVFAFVMAVVLTALGAFLYLRLGSSLDEQIGDELESRGVALASVVRASGGREVDPSLLAGEEGVARVVGPRTSGVVALATPTTRVVLLTGEELAAVRQGSTLTTERDGFAVRAEPVDDRVIVVGKPLDDRDEALDALLTQLLVALPLALLVSAGIGYLVAGGALRPVEAMRRQADEISADTPERRLSLPEANDEIRRLGETLNEMLERLDAGLARERRFVADASHELRTPLAVLRTELDLALRAPRSPEELADAVRSAGEEVERLVRLAEDLLVLARADESRLPLRMESHRAREVLEGVAIRSEARAGHAGRALEVSAPEGQQITGDRLRLEQALGNLVDNALRYGEGTVRLDARTEDGWVALSVSDAGAGFPPDFLPHAFDRFTRADSARSGGGSGLGLAIVDTIARAHGGRATVANREGAGAVVTMFIPARP